MKPTTKKTTKTENGKKTTGKAPAAPALAARELTVSAPAPKPLAAQPSLSQSPKPAPPATKPGKITLQLEKPGASKVLVAGSFNGWKPEATPLTPLGNGRWTGNLDVKPGKYEYLFVVDGNWMPDPNATESVANPFGGLNSVLTVRN